jgi:asparagine synthase (glutamine-hydrolysing)
MLAFFAGPRSAEPGFSDRIAASLGLFAQLAAPVWRDGHSVLAQLPSVDQLPPRHMRSRQSPLWRQWQPARAASGRLVLFHGWFDNCAAIATELGVENSDPAFVYGAAVDRWEDNADDHLLGHYCTILHDPQTRSARLARSALRAPPLHYFHGPDSIGASSVPRVLEIMGLARLINPRKMVDALYFNPTEDEDFLVGSWRVGLGNVVHLAPADRRKHCFFDPLDQPHGTNRGKSADLVAEADHLLEEAAAVAIAGARKPGVQLSAGLDSSNVAARILRVLPPGQRLKSFTNIPSSGCTQEDVPFHCLNEQSGVEAFAALHPRLDTHFINNEGVGFDHRLETMFLAMGTGQSCLPMNFRFHGLFQRARDEGCDLILSSDLGESTFSSWGDWGYSEYFCRLRWGKLYQALAADDIGDRAMVRRLISRALVPLLPDRWWKAMRRWLGKDTQPLNVHIAGLRQSALTDDSVIERARAAGVSFERDQYASRRQLRIDQLARGDIESSDYQQGLEQLYEVRLRDVPAYRPLFTFCTSLPTEMFMRDGTMRWLARELGRGEMPEAQRKGRNIGIQYSDWHALLTPRVAEMRAAVKAARTDPELDRFIDFDVLDQTLDNWPVQSSLDDAVYFPCAFTLPRALAMVRYLQFMTGSNQAGLQPELTK